MRRILTPLALSLSLTTSVHAVERHVPLGYPTIFDAVAVAEPGDTVVIAPGSYAEPISMTGKFDVTVRGIGKVKLTSAANDYGVRIANCQDIRVENLTLPSGLDYGVLVESSAGVHLVGLEATDEALAGVRVIGGEEARVESCRFVDCGHGVHGQGPVTVAGCEVVGAVFGGVLLEGDGSAALDNELKKCGNGVSVLGDAAIVSGNSIKSPIATGISLLGASKRHTVRDNVITKAGAFGILIQAHHSSVTFNKVKKSQIFSIQDDGHGNHLAKNKGAKNG